MRVLFIHHSTGGNLIREGNVRQNLHRLAPEIEFWDHGYNLSPFLPNFLARATYKTGLSDQNGKMTGKDFNIVISNNSPKEYADLFSTISGGPTLKSILGFDLIIFKNCYPTTKIVSEKQLDQYKNYYQKIVHGTKRFPHKQFLLLTSPPLRKELTTPGNAQRAQRLNEWLTKEEFSKTSKNLSVFDLFGLLSNEFGFLKKEYCRTFFWDSHPNRKANEEIGPKFVNKIISVSTS